jgi:hypothetical protein
MNDVFMICFGFLLIFPIDLLQDQCHFHGNFDLNSLGAHK